MNKELLEKVKAHILEEPKRLFMPDILRHSLPLGYKRELPSCGTMGCFAGWICVLSGKDDYFNVSSWNAAELAGLDVYQAGRLFFGAPDEWSPEDRMKLWSGDGTPETAALAARRIDEFIASDGAI